LKPFLREIKLNIPGKEYNVYLGRESFKKLSDILQKEKLNGKFFLVIDSKVNKLYSNVIDQTFNRIGTSIKKTVIVSSEKNKSYAALQKIHSVLIKNNFGRDSIIVAIGGGIIGDIAGFAAATFMRGVKYIQIPTTLLSGVDSSVGGKTGINFNDTKNVIGSFHQPSLVVIDTEFFKTLPEEEQLCGLGEIVKYGFLTNERFFNFLKKNIQSILTNKEAVINKVISESIKFKGNIVEADEKESGIRKLLNLGHTFAHAFEVQQKHKLKHGQAVIVGITCSLYLARELKVIYEKDFFKYLNFLLLFTGKIKLAEVNTSVIYNIMKRDKKNRQNEIRFVLVNKIGSILTDVPAEKKKVIHSINQAIQHF
jgi:3-dehydroquinate synthase